MSTETAEMRMERLEAARRAVARFSHDLNNALTALRGHAELALLAARAGTPVGDRLQRMIGAIERVAARNRRVALASGPPVLARVSTDLAPALRERAGELERALVPGVDLRLELPGSLPPVEADVDALASALVELLRNAARASPRGGTVVVSADERQLDTADLEHLYLPLAARPGPYLSIEVRDEGEGMEPLLLARAAEPGVAGEGGRPGLGLAIAAAVAEAHGGALDLDSSPGDGTCATLFLPLVECAPG